jgi:hypothetical protein
MSLLISGASMVILRRLYHWSPPRRAAALAAMGGIAILAWYAASLPIASRL